MFVGNRTLYLFEDGWADSRQSGVRPTWASSNIRESFEKKHNSKILDEYSLNWSFSQKDAPEWVKIYLKNLEIYGKREHGEKFKSSSTLVYPEKSE